MKEQISHLAHELSKIHNFNRLKHHVRKILLSNKIITAKSKLSVEDKNRNTDDCFFSCYIEPEQNNLNKTIQIMVKPDHSGCRQLRVLIQVGDKIIADELEKKDRKDWNDRKVFDKELKDAEKGIRTALRKAA